MKRPDSLHVFCLFIPSAMAQQEIMLSQYMFNQMVVNPGYPEARIIFLPMRCYRTQWSTFPVRQRLKHFPFTLRLA